MSISSTDPLSIDLANALVYVAEQDPAWEDFAGAVHEVDFAYSLMCAPLPSPKLAVEAFLSSCLDREFDQEFWKRWNYTAVEGFEGKPAMKVTWLAPEVKMAVDRVLKSIVEPGTLSGKRLFHFYAAMVVLNEVAASSDCEAMEEVISVLLDACRTALVAKSSLEIS